MKTKTFALALGALLSAIAVGGPPIPLVKVSGSVTLIGCSALKQDVSLRLSSGGGGSPTTATTLADGSTRMGFSFVVGNTESEPDLPISVRASLRTGVCPGGSWSPATVTLNHLPGNAAFTYRRVPARVVRLRADELARKVDDKLRDMQLRLHNYGGNGSFVQILGISQDFAVPVATKSVGLGEGRFYLNDIRSSDVSLGWNNGAFLLALQFEDREREIKGLHSSVGDNGMPDFEISNPVLVVKARPQLLPRLGVSLGFYEAKLRGGIQSTGACNIFGADICNFVWGTDAQIQKAAQNGALSALNSNRVQTLLQLAVAQLLRDVGITTEVISVTSDASTISLGVL